MPPGFSIALGITLLIAAGLYRFVPAFPLEWFPGLMLVLILAFRKQINTAFAPHVLTGVPASRLIGFFTTAFVVPMVLFATTSLSPSFWAAFILISHAILFARPARLLSGFALLALYAVCVSTGFPETDCLMLSAFGLLLIMQGESERALAI